MANMEFRKKRSRSVSPQPRPSKIPRPIWRSDTATAPVATTPNRESDDAPEDSIGASANSPALDTSEPSSGDAHTGSPPEDDLGDSVDGAESTTFLLANQGYGVDKESGLPHKPENDGVFGHDQTAQDGRGQYQTRVVGQKKKAKAITIDQARAKPSGVPQWHRTFCYFNAGRWERPIFTDEFNTPDAWSDVALVERLNRWRQQTNQRQGWRPKRTEVRDKYDDEQKRMVWDADVARKGKKGKDKVTDKQIADSFNTKYGLTGDNARHASGITSLLKRMKDEEKYGKRTKPKPKKGKAGAQEVGKSATGMTAEDYANAASTHHRELSIIDSDEPEAESAASRDTA